MSSRYMTTADSRSFITTFSMRFVLALIALCACLLDDVQGQAFIETVPEHPLQPGKCLYQGTALRVNKVVTDRSTCTRLICRKTNNKHSPFQVEGTGCDIMSSAGNCRVEKSSTKRDYPGCCPRFHCGT